MEGRKRCVSIGAKVKIVPQHWLRAYEEGLIVDHKCRARNCWLVKFDHSYLGGGVDGDKLWLDESQFAEVSHEGSRAMAIGGIIETDESPLRADDCNLH